MTERVDQGGNQIERSSHYGLISALVALAGLGIALLSGEFRHISWLLRPAGIAFLLLELAALSVALIGAIQAARCTTPEGDRSLLILGGGLALVLIVLGLGPVVRRGPGPHAEIIAQQTCGADLWNLGVAMAAYSRAHNGRYPTPEKWCDLLMAEAKDPSGEVVRCLGGKEGRCHYAMNPLADPCSAPDVVLLLECRDGWNRFGGAEILTMRHQRGKSCNVLFVNGHVEFIEAERIPLLRWEGKVGL